jgi:hypothetical protein
MNKMTGSKRFTFGQRVHVKLPREPAIIGHVYSWYRDRPGSEAIVCVTTPTGSGVGYKIRYVTAAGLP